MLYFQYVPHRTGQLWGGAEWQIVNELGEVANLLIRLKPLTEDGFLAFKERYPEPEELEACLIFRSRSTITYSDLAAFDGVISDLDLRHVPGDILELPEQGQVILNQIGAVALWTEPAPHWIDELLDGAEVREDDDA